MTWCLVYAYLNTKGFSIAGCALLLKHIPYLVHKLIQNTYTKLRFKFSMVKSNVQETMLLVVFQSLMLN